MLMRDRPELGGAGGRLLRAEIEEIESMTPEEVRGGLREFGLEPTEVLPWQVKRLLDAGPPPAAPGREILRPYRAALWWLLRPFERLNSVWAIDLFVVTVMILISFVYPKPANAVTLTPAKTSLPSSMASGAPQGWYSDTGNNDNPCTRIAPCRNIQGAASRTVIGGELRFINAGGTDELIRYNINDY